MAKAVTQRSNSWFFFSTLHVHFRLKQLFVTTQATKRAQEGT